MRGEGEGVRGERGEGEGVRGDSGFISECATAGAGQVAANTCKVSEPG